MDNILKTRYTGFFKGKFIAINPNKEKLEEILQEEVEEPVYKYENGVRFDLYIENISGGEVFKHSIYLSNKDEEFKSGAKRFINEVGESQMTNKEENLFDSMKFYQNWDNENKVYITTDKEKQVRVAKVGEYEITQLYKLTKKFTGFIDVNNIIESGELDIVLGIPNITCFAYVQNNEEYTQRLFKEFLYLDDYLTFINNTISKYNKKRYDNWHRSFSFIADSSIYNFGRLQSIKEEFIPKEKDFNSDDSNY